MNNLAHMGYNPPLGVFFKHTPLCKLIESKRYFCFFAFLMLIWSVIVFKKPLNPIKLLNESSLKLFPSILLSTKCMCAGKHQLHERHWLWDCPTTEIVPPLIFICQCHHLEAIPKMDISPSKRTKILTLHPHCSKIQWEIAKLIGVSQASVSRIVRKGSEFGSSPNRKGRCGRKRQTSPRDEAVLIRESKKNPRKTSDALGSAGVSISSSTVRRRIIEVGRTARRPVKKQLLTMAMKKKRYNWALKFIDWTCKN